MDFKKTDEKKDGERFTAEVFQSETGIKETIITLKHPERVQLKTRRYF